MLLKDFSNNTHVDIQEMFKDHAEDILLYFKDVKPLADVFLKMCVLGLLIYNEEERKDKREGERRGKNYLIFIHEIYCVYFIFFAFKVLQSIL